MHVPGTSFKLNASNYDLYVVLTVLATPYPDTSLVFYSTDFCRRNITLTCRVRNKDSTRDGDCIMIVASFFPYPQTSQKQFYNERTELYINVVFIFNSYI